MCTTMDLPEDLLSEAMRLFHVKTRRMVVTLGLQELIHKHRMERLRALIGKVDLDVDIRKSPKR